MEDLANYLTKFAGRPTPLYFAKNLTEYLGGSNIFLKREDLLHGGAHKTNNTLGQALLAKRMGKKRVIAETGAGQHGVGTAIACAALKLHARGLSRLQPVAVLAGVVLALSASTSQVQEMGSRSQGFALAREICAPCHAIQSGDNTSPNPSAPSFETISSVPGMTSIALAVALRTSHETMPNIILDDGELQNISAYILGLKEDP